MIAALHILGALFTLILVSTLLYFLGAWLGRKSAARILEQASLDFARPLAEISSPAFEHELVRYLGAKYSDDLLKNRLSDFFGLLITALNWLVSLLELVVLAGVAWFSFTEDPANAVFAWFVLLLPAASFVIGVTVSLVCKLVTGRFPGQAQQVRKSLTQSINHAMQPVA